MTSQYVNLPLEGGAAAGVTSVNAITGAVVLVAGTNITITPSGQNITIDATGGGGGITSINGDGTAAQLIVAASTGTDFTIATSGGTTTVAAPSASATARGLVTTGAQTLAGAKTFSTAPVFSALTASTVPYLDASKVLTSSAVTPTQLSYVDATSSIQTQLNAKQATLTIGNLTSGTTGVAVSGGTGAVIGSGTSITVQTASGSQPGLLSSADWTTFNGKGSGTVTSVGVVTNSTTSSIFTNTANAITGSPVTTSGNMTLSLLTQAANIVLAGPTTGAAAAPTFRALVGADLPNPSSSTLGGVQSIAAVSHQFITTISTSGVPTLAQPAFTDISGSVAAAQMPALTGDVTTSAGAVATTVAKIQGTTVSGTTGTTNVVFSASPTITGTISMSGGSQGGGDIVSGSGSYLTIGSVGRFQINRTLNFMYLIGNMGASSDGASNLGCDSGGDPSGTGACRMGKVSGLGIYAYNNLYVGTGTNQVAGKSVLVAGTVTVSNTKVASTSIIQLTCQVVGGTQGILSVGTITANTSFVINSSNGADTSTVGWTIFTPAP